MTENILKQTRDSNGRFAKGNPGKPKGAKSPTKIVGRNVENIMFIIIDLLDVLEAYDINVSNIRKKILKEKIVLKNYQLKKSFITDDFLDRRYKNLDNDKKEEKRISLKIKRQIKQLKQCIPQEN